MCECLCENKKNEFVFIYAQHLLLPEVCLLIMIVVVIVFIDSDSGFSSKTTLPRYSSFWDVGTVIKTLKV